MPDVAEFMKRSPVPVCTWCTLAPDKPIAQLLITPSTGGLITHGLAVAGLTGGVGIQLDDSLGLSPFRVVVF
jgi:hypothetical protein